MIKKKIEKKPIFENIPFDIIFIIIRYLEIKDIINLSFSNKMFHYICNYYLKNRYKKFTDLLLYDYYDIIEIDKKLKDEIKIKSYMFYNSINPFKNNNYFFISKIYLDEIYECDFLPKNGYLKFYIGYKIIAKKHINIGDEINFDFDNIFSAKIVYNKEKNKSKKYILKGRKYIIIKKLNTLPLSDIRTKYISKNIQNIENANVFKFSNNYLFGPPTYFGINKNPINEVRSYIHYTKNEIYDDLILIATFNPMSFFSSNKNTKEMISFVTRKLYLKDLKFDKVWVVYNNEKEN